MRFVRKYSVLLSLGLLAACSTHHGHWDYDSANKWGDMSAEFTTCKVGKFQSPIDIQSKSAKKAALPAITTQYQTSAANVQNNGHTIQVNLDNGGVANLPSGDYQLLQFHFHTPSEESVDGKFYPLVAHLVHKNAEGKLAVIGVFFKEGAENKALKSVFDLMPTKEAKVALPSNFDTTSILPSNRAYYTFAGSLTTPPCSEDVAWHIMKTPIELSRAQLDAFKKLYPMNARPIQAGNGREILSVE